MFSVYMYISHITYDVVSRIQVSYTTTISPSRL